MHFSAKLIAQDSYGMPVIPSCSLAVIGQMSFLPCQAKQSPKSQGPGKPSRKLMRKNLSEGCPEEAGPRQSGEPRKGDLAELREVDVTFEKGTAVLEKYHAEYRELAGYIREIVPGERRIEIRQRLEGEDIDLHLFAIRVQEDEVRYEVKLSGDAEHKTAEARPSGSLRCTTS